MNLVSIETAAEQLLITSGLQESYGNSHYNSLHSLVLRGHLIPTQDKTFWWTSGSEASRGRWTWTATGRELNYTNWDSVHKEPKKKDNSKHGVVMTWYIQRVIWIVDPVTKEFFPLCEK
jgi:hypothetical protein